MEKSYKLFIVMLSAFTLAACGNDSGDEENTEDTSQDTASEETTEETDSTNEDENNAATESEGSDEGSGNTENTNEPDESSSEDDTNDTSDSNLDGNSDTISLDDITTDPSEAISLAQDNFDGELVGFELDNDDNAWVYEVEMENDNEDYEVQFSVEDLSVVSEETEEDNNINIDQFNYEDAIPYDEAVQTAIDESGGDLEGFTLDMDDGRLEYEIELRNTSEDDDLEVLIDAESGEIIEIDD